MSVAATKQISKPFYQGIWIDKSRAFLIRYDQDGVNIKEMNSLADRTSRSTGGKQHPGVGRGTATNERKLEAHREKIEREFYQKVVNAIGTPEEIFLIGPGQAKIALRKELQAHSQLKDRIVGFETHDKMSQNQLRALVQTYFEQKRNRSF